MLRPLLLDIATQQRLPELCCWQVGYIVRRQVNCAHFHHDLRGVGNMAFAVMVPLNHHVQTHLLVRHGCGRPNEAEAVCLYRPGKAIVIGEDVYHASQPGKADCPQVFLHCVCAPHPTQLDRCTVDALKRALQTKYFASPTRFMGTPTPTYTTCSTR